jgi:putative addiction module killer protein
MRYNENMFEVLEYLTDAGDSPFSLWVDGLNDAQTVARIDARVGRLVEGLFGDCKPVGDGVWELRIDWGPGYRVYYAQSGKLVLLLLCGGDKRHQKADIKRAMKYWEDWQRRTA